MCWRVGVEGCSGGVASRGAGKYIVMYMFIYMYMYMHLGSIVLRGGSGVAVCVRRCFEGCWRGDVEVCQRGAVEVMPAGYC